MYVVMKKICILLVMLLFLSACSKQQDISGDISGDDDNVPVRTLKYEETLEVAVLKDMTVASCCLILARELPKVPLIMKVKCIDDNEYVLEAGHQRVRVEKVFCGNGIVSGEEIYVCSEHWGISTPPPISTNRSFVNVMEPGEEYLVFCTGEKVEIEGEDSLGYELYHSVALAPVFLYGEREHTSVELAEDAMDTYVLYSEVQGNEMFAETEEGYRLWLKLKELLFEMYPDD